MKCLVSVVIHRCQCSIWQGVSGSLFESPPLCDVGLTVRYEAAEISADDAVPGWALALVKLSTNDVSCVGLYWDEEY